jgi:ATP-dependent exoDNAse (exonuclease V) alpha subunit
MHLKVILGYYNDPLPASLRNDRLEKSKSTHRTTEYFYANVSWQLPIINAFALTIHKVQGLSLPSVTLGLNKNFFSDWQAYVGLSRATASERLFLTQLDFDVIKADPEAIAEYERLRTVALQLET